MNAPEYELCVAVPVAVRVGLTRVHARETSFCAWVTRSSARARSGEWSRSCASASASGRTGPSGCGSGTSGGSGWRIDDGAGASTGRTGWSICARRRAAITRGGRSLKEGLLSTGDAGLAQGFAGERREAKLVEVLRVDPPERVGPRRSGRAADLDRDTDLAVRERLLDDATFLQPPLHAHARPFWQSGRRVRHRREIPHSLEERAGWPARE